MYPNAHVSNLWPMDRVRHAMALAFFLLLSLLGTSPAFASWSANFGGQMAGTSSVTSTTTDASNSVYAVGKTNAVALTLGGFTERQIGKNTDAFVVKRASNGTVLWIKRFGGSGASVTVTPNHVKVDASGNVYVVGIFQGGSMTVPALTKISGTETFVVKLDAIGNILWAKNIGGSTASTLATGTSVGVDGSGNVFVGGYFSGGNLTTPAALSLAGTGSQTSFLIKLDASGDFVWANRYGSTAASSQAHIYDLAVDAAGNAYATGYAYSSSGTLDVPFSPALTIRTNLQSAFAFTVDPTGTTHSWYKAFVGTSANTQATGIALDGSGNVYLGGYFSSGNTAAPNAMTKVGTGDTFAIKLDSSGTTVWAKNQGGAGATANTDNHSIAVDASGNAYLTGYFNANLTSGVGGTLTKVGTQDGFTLKLDSSGATTWAVNHGGAGATTKGAGIAVDGTGNVYLGGMLSGASLTTPVGAALTLSQTGATDGLLFKLDSSGAVAQTTPLNGNAGASTVVVRQTAVDGGGNVYIAGIFDAFSINVGGTTLTRIGTQDAFAAKYTSAGALLWAHNYGGAGAASRADGIHVDSAGIAYITGSLGTASMTTPSLTKSSSTNPDGFVIKIDAAGNNPSVLANIYGSGSTQVNPSRVRTDATGNVYVAGYFQTASVTFPTALTKLGNADAFLFKFNAAGTPVWARNYGGAAASMDVLGFDIDTSGDVYLSGNFVSSGGLTQPVAVAKIGGYDGYVMKVNSAGSYQWLKQFAGPGAWATSKGLRVSGSDVFISGQLQYADMTTVVAYVGATPAVSVAQSLVRIGTADFYAAKLAASDGALAWIQNYGGPGATMINDGGLALDGLGHILLGGSFSGADLTTPALTRIGIQDLAVLTLDAANGTVSAVNGYGGSGATGTAGSVAANSSAFTLAGNFQYADLTTPSNALLGQRDGLVINQTSGVFTGVPSAPTGATAALAGSGKATITFTAPLTNGGSAITTYTATSNPGGFSGTCAGPAACSITVTGLTDGTIYNFSVTASNSNGTSSASTASNSVIPGNAATVPGAPLAVTGTAGDMQVTVSWAAPGSNGGAAVTGYRVQMSTTSGGVYADAAGTCAPASTSSSAAVTCTATGLTNGTAYFFKVAAINSVGTGSYSGASSGITPTPPPATVPGAPTSVGGTAGNTQVSVSWTAPGSTGGAAITGYRVQVSTSSGGTYADAAGTCAFATTDTSTAVTCTATGLTNGTAYFFKVAAINSVGTGSYSAASSGVTPVTPAVNGACATISATAFAPTTGLCTQGTAPSSATPGSPWTWSCTGTGGGTTASCSAPNATTATGSGTGRAALSGGTWVVDEANSGFVATSTVPSLPPGYTFPHGLLNLKLTAGAAGSTATVVITYPSALPGGTVYWKYGRTASNPTAHWYQFAGAIVAGNTITLTLTDGADGDDDMAANSVIADPGGPGMPAASSATSIPTLSEWGLIILSSLMALLGLRQARRRR